MGDAARTRGRLDGALELEGSSMIPCMKCGQAVATHHLTHITQEGQQTTLHLCAACAQQNQLIQAAGAGLNIPHILKVLIGAHVGAWSDELSRLACPSCGIKYMEFRSAGRLGCSHDYDVFRAGLTHLLEKIHRATRHQGKSPRHRRLAQERHWELLKLRQALREAVEREEYERAAELRDRIREREAQA